MIAFIRNILLPFAALTIALSCPFQLCAQGIAVGHITIDNGLINNEITAIHQDHSGFIWFGTRGGLNRYDGYEFNTIRAMPRSSNNLSNQAVEVIAEAGKVLWIGNKTGGLNRYDLLTDSITHFNPPGAVKIQEIKSLLVDRSGDVFIGALHGLYIFRAGKFVIVDQALTVTALAEDDHQRIWVGTSYGLFKYNARDNRLDSISLGERRFEVTSIAIDSLSGTLYLGTWGNGLVKYLPETNAYKKYMTGAGPFGHAIDNTYRVLIDKQRTVWVGTWGGGLRRFDRNSETFESIQIKPPNVYSKDYDIVLSLMQDEAGILWIGTDGGGVCKIDPYQKRFKVIGNSGADDPVLPNTHITALFIDASGGLWLGTKGGGLLFSADKRNFITKDLGFKTIRINCFFDNEGDLWVGTGDGLVIFKDYKHATRRLFVRRDGADSTSLSGPKVTSIIKDKSGVIWVGTQEHGLNRVVSFRNGLPVFRHYPERVGVVGALQNNRISCMLADRHNHLWIGTYDGLHLYNREQDRFEVISSGNDQRNGLSNNTILSLAEDGDGHIWVGTQQGLSRLSVTDSGRFEIASYYQGPGFPNDYIHAILIDRDNNVWMSTNKGITKYNIRVKNFRNFDIRDGISSNMFSENACFTADDGELYFGSINGVTYFYPDSIYLNHFRPPVYITKVQVNDRDVAGAGLTGGEKLSYNENMLSFTYAALDYHAPDKNQYQYKLDGFDEQWVNAGSRRSVTYTNLPSGSYTFQVRATNSEQTWGEDIALFKFGISPPPWKTWWAYLGYILIGGGVLWLSRYIKLKRIYLKNELAMANLNYAKEHEIAEIKNTFFTNISHEFKTPLTLMIGPLDDLSNDGELPPSKKSTIRKVQNQSRRLLSLINQLLDFHKAEERALRLSASYTDIVGLTKEIADMFSEEAARKKINFVYGSQKRELCMLVDREKLESIVYNLLSNAFKFTPPGGDISFQVRYQGEPEPVCELVVSDSGGGIGAEEKGKIFDRFYQVNQAEPGAYTGTGIGLAFVKDLVELHKGSIRLEDNQPQGSVFTVRLPARTIDQLDDDLIAGGAGAGGRGDTAEQDGEAENGQVEAPIFLVVEDNEELNQYLCKVLRRSGRVISAKDGKEGLAKALRTIPDLVVSDVMMPEMTGYQLCKALKEDYRTSHIPVILLAAKSDDLSYIEGISQGADIYLGKPFKPAVLTSHVKNLIKSRQKLKELFAQHLNLAPSEIEVASSNEEFIKNAIHFVEENMDKEEFSIDDLAVSLNMSRSTFYRKLKAVTGMSGADFIRSIKLQRSAQLLKSGEYTVGMAAFSAGFTDLKHFRKSFQKQFGVTPSEYMKGKEDEGKS